MARRAFLFAAFLLFLVKGGLSQEGDTESLSTEDQERIRDILRLQYTLSPYEFLFPLNPCKFVLCDHVT